jgi:hypothetical protein
MCRRARSRTLTCSWALVRPSEARWPTGGPLPRHWRRRTGANSIEAHHRRKPGRLGFIVFIVVLLTSLLLLGLILVALIGYLTLIVMTIALAAGLALVVALV